MAGNAPADPPRTTRDATGTFLSQIKDIAIGIETWVTLHMITRERERRATAEEVSGKMLREMARLKAIVEEGRKALAEGTGNVWNTMGMETDIEPKWAQNLREEVQVLARQFHDSTGGRTEGSRNSWQSEGIYIKKSYNKLYIISFYYKIKLYYKKNNFIYL